MNILKTAVNAFSKEEDGQDLVEYSLLLSVIALGALSFIVGAGTSVSGIWSYISTHLTSAIAAS